ncbi:hypothetical protein D3C84_1172240 [compost metagenome]
MRTTRRRLNMIDWRSLKISSCLGRGWGTLIGPTWRQAMDASALSSARPSAPEMPPVRARDT